jgi:uncharacterized phage infection (PIP) family protein YhgE
MTANEFLNPKSMTTPGAMGGVVILIANSLFYNFEISPLWTALAVSLLLGIAVSVSIEDVVHKSIFAVLNALVIFSFATGVNQTIQSGQKIDARSSISNSSVTDVQNMRSRLDAVLSDVESVRSGVKVENDVLALMRTRSFAEKGQVDEIAEYSSESAQRLSNATENLRAMEKQLSALPALSADPAVEKRFFSDWLR